MASRATSSYTSFLSVYLNNISLPANNSRNNLLLSQALCAAGGIWSSCDLAKMSSTTTVQDADVFPTVSMPFTVVLTGILVFVIFTGFYSLFFWRYLLNRLFSAWNLQQPPYGDIIHVAKPPETTGLDPVIIQSFPVVLYSSVIMKDQRLECAICLSEFSDQDPIRLITVCRHAFHSNCIDLWFELHKNCPVCRCELDPELVGSGSHESLHNSVTLTIQDINHDEENPPTTTSSKRLTEASAWRFSRSHSTGHFMLKTTDFNEKIKRRHYQTGSCITFDELTRYDDASEYGWLGESLYISKLQV